MLLDYGFWYFNACFTFLLGILWGIYNKKVISWIHKYYQKILFFLSFGFLVFFILPKFFVTFSGSLLYELSLLICNQLSSMFFCMFVIILNQKLHFTNLFFHKIGQMSFEIYMIHGLFIFILRNDEWYLKSDLLFTVIVFIGSIISARLLHFLDRYVLSKYFAFVAQAS